MFVFFISLFTWMFHNVLIHTCRQQNIFPCNKMVLNMLMADPLMTIFGHYYLYLCHLLEFNSHLTSERRSTEITDDYSSSCTNNRIWVFRQNKWTVLKHTKRIFENFRILGCGYSTTIFVFSFSSIADYT